MDPDARAAKGSRRSEGYQLHVGGRSLRVMGFRGKRELNQVGRLLVETVLEDGEQLDSSEVLLGTRAYLDAHDGHRVFSGDVARVSLMMGGDALLCFTLEAPVARLQRRMTSRLFGSSTVIDVLVQLLSEHRINTVRRLQRTYGKREHLVQYRQSDYDFFCRLCAEEGLIWFHDEEARLLIIDEAGAYLSLATI